MKKKNTKIKEIWLKVKKPLIILSIVGNILFLLFIIVGCVGQKKSTQTKAEDNIEVFTLRDTQWRINEQFSKSPNGLVIGQDTINESYSIVFRSGPEDYVYSRLVFSGYGSNFDLSGYLNNSLRTFAQRLNGEIVWRDSTFRDIFLDEDNSGIGDFENKKLINWFKENAILVGDFENSIFTFESSINYNAPYDVNIDSIFVNQHWDDVTTIGKEIVYDLPLFLSNGQLFNRIRLWFQNGNAVSYIDELYNNYQIRTNTNEHTAYYGFMQFINTYTDVRVDVNHRLFRTSATSSTDANVKTAVVKGSFWENDNYRYLAFQQVLTPTQTNTLAQFNSSYNLTGFGDVSNDVGLGNAFTLISQGFGGLTNIFKIQLLPNISLGLLLFLPLIVIVIITIIKLVKR